MGYSQGTGVFNIHPGDCAVQASVGITALYCVNVAKPIFHFICAYLVSLHWLQSSLRQDLVIFFYFGGLID